LKISDKSGDQKYYDNDEDHDWFAFVVFEMEILIIAESWMLF